jgi:hypothetical protein
VGIVATNGDGVVGFMCILLPSRSELRRQLPVITVLGEHEDNFYEKPRVVREAEALFVAEQGAL